MRDNTSLIRKHIIVFYREKIPEQLYESIKTFGPGLSIVKDGCVMRGSVPSFRFTILINSSNSRDFKQKTSKIKAILDDFKKRFLIDEYEANF